jgi:ParB family transcriptional regulator, chromosome partitioning protein
MAAKSGLGRGLDSLIPRGGPGIGEVPIASIQPNPRQPRHQIGAEDLAELTASIREHGVIEPIVVTRAVDGEGYVLIAGERRWTAASLAGLTQIPAVIKEATPRQMLELALVENVQRSDLNPLEEAAAYQELIAEFGLTQDEVARRVGRSRSTIANSIRLLGLPETVRIALASGAISEGHARALLGAPDTDSLHSAYLDVLARGLNVRQTEERVRRARVDPVLPAGRSTFQPAADPEARQIEEMFREALGTKVEVIRSGVGGRLVIYFYGDEQLQSLYGSLTRP